MSILIQKGTKVLVQGITGRDGSFHAKTMVADGTLVVGGVTPGKGGSTVEGMPVWNSIREAQDSVGTIDATVIFVPAAFADKAMDEAAKSGIKLVICITEGVPIRDMLYQWHQMREQGIVLIGPNCPGLITPGGCKIGIMPAKIHKPGSVGIISRSGTLTYEVVHALTRAGYGQSTAVGIGGDPVVGTGYIDLLDRFNKDDATHGVVLIGEIGGEEEELAADWIGKHMNKPVVSFISGRSAPKGKRMGHAGAIISGKHGGPEAKLAAFKAVDVPVADTPSQIPHLLRNHPRGFRP